MDKRVLFLSAFLALLVSGCAQQITQPASYVTWAGSKWAVEGEPPAVNGIEAIGKISCNGVCHKNGSLTATFDRKTFQMFSLKYAANNTVTSSQPSFIEGNPVSYMGGYISFKTLDHEFPVSKLQVVGDAKFNELRTTTVSVSKASTDAEGDKFSASIRTSGFPGSTSIFRYNSPTYTIRFDYGVNSYDPNGKSELEYKIEFVN